MGSPRSGRTRRVAAPPTVEGGPARTPDFATAFAADVAGTDTRSAEQWARSVLEGAPRPLRWFVVLGWRLVLRLRLAPAATPGTVAGWTIVHATPDSITLEVKSRTITAHKVLRLDGDEVTLATYVRYDRTAGRLLWSALKPVHHCIEPLLLRSGTTRGR